ncbi:hypothetical protein EYF80_045651 [Liparis tanakae]|uniref:Uncharacterized protein n=1 Tax=Liparis tanakae TaxID=230148 RepID=A0A4Z2FUX7_9TELE|nr:hypothetical protein EYF80_045651 [Liparis tanakae]
MSLMTTDVLEQSDSRTWSKDIADPISLRDTPRHTRSLEGFQTDQGLLPSSPGSPSASLCLAKMIRTLTLSSGEDNEGPEDPGPAEPAGCSLRSAAATSHSADQSVPAQRSMLHRNNALRAAAERRLQQSAVCSRAPSAAERRLQPRLQNQAYRLLQVWDADADHHGVARGLLHGCCRAAPLCTGTESSNANGNTAVLFPGAAAVGAAPLAAGCCSVLE